MSRVESRIAEQAMSYDRYARMIQRLLGLPTALVTVLDGDRPRIAGSVGLSAPADSSTAVASFCQRSIADGRPVAVDDVRQQASVTRDPAIAELGALAHALFPILDFDGSVIGALCAVDTKPRPWDADSLAILSDLAAACSSEINERATARRAAENAREAEDQSRRSQVLLSLSEGLSSTQSAADIAHAVEMVSLIQLGCSRSQLWLLDDAELSFVVPRGSQSSMIAVPAAGKHPLGHVVRTGAAAFLTETELRRLYPHVPEETLGGEGYKHAFLPLVVGHVVYGALSMTWDYEGRLSQEDRWTLEALASYTAQALQRTALIEERIEALVTLQNAMLPVLPSPTDLTLTARYLPAATRDQVGGDWYDAVVNGSVTSVIIGDVMGHDINAAAHMGQLSTVLRTIAWTGEPGPATNVERFDQALADLKIEALATLVYLRIDPTLPGTSSRAIRWTNAGHPPPLLVTPDGRASYLSDGVGDLMIGVLPTFGRHDHTAVVPVGSTILLYTDGLIERSGEDLDVGLERLRRTAEEHHDPTRSTETFVDRLLAASTEGQLADDVVVLGVRLDR